MKRFDGEEFIVVDINDTANIDGIGLVKCVEAVDNYPCVRCILNLTPECCKVGCIPEERPNGDNEGEHGVYFIKIEDNENI